MKRIFAISLLCCLLLTACSRADGDAVPTTEPPVTEAPTASPPPTDASAESSTDAPTDKPTDSDEPLEEPYALCEIATTANCYRDSQGAIWAQSIIAVTNVSNAPLFLNNSSSAVLQDANGTEVTVIKNISAYPQVIEPGEIGYYYEETQLDLGETTDLTLLPDIQVHEATEDELLLSAPLTVTNGALSESVYGGLRLTGHVEGCNGLTCISAVLFDENDTPLGLLFNLTSIDGESDFELNSFMLPEELTAGQVASYRVFAYAYQQ